MRQGPGAWTRWLWEGGGGRAGLGPVLTRGRRGAVSIGHWIVSSSGPGLSGGRHDGPGPQPLRAAVGDFGRLFRLPWRADRRLPDSDQVRPAGGLGWGALAGLGEEIVRVGHAKRVCVFWKSGSCGDAGVASAR